jgi:hypothetical protein
MLPTMSKVERVLACPASHALPQTYDPPSVYADAGNERHAAAADHLAVGVIPSKPEVAAWLDGVSEALEELRGARIEVAYALDVLWSEARVIGYNIGRQYGARSATEIVGSADYVSVEPNRLAVVDLKTGHGEVTPPAENGQLLTLGLAASLAHRHSGPVELALLLAPGGMMPRWQRATVSQDRLQAHGEALARMHVAIDEARADVDAGRAPRHLAQGDHCRYCPAKAACPARIALARGTLESPVEQAAGWRAMMAAGKRAEVYRLWRAARDVLGEVGDALHASAAETPIDLGDGEVFGRREVTRTAIDAEAAWPLLAESFGSSVARAAMTLDTSKAGVARAAQALWEQRKAAGVKSTKKATEAEVMAVVAPAMTTKKSERFEQFHTGREATNE